jgi:hypothetical protein
VVSTYPVALLGMLGLLLFISIVLLRRHQRWHCGHLHALSDAVVALSTFIGERVPGELPPDVAEFVRWYRDPKNADEYLEEDKADA